MSLDFESLSLTEIIQLQNQLSVFLARRYEKCQAVVFSDITGSTAYFARFGNETGRRLQQRHADLILKSIEGSGGRIVDTAGDGVFLCFPHVSSAIETMSRFQSLRVLANHNIPREHQFTTRTAIHWGAVLTDGVIATGDPVNLCAKIAATAKPGEIYVTNAVFLELNVQQRLRCRRIEPATVTGVCEPIDVFTFAWADTERFPAAVIIEETGEHISLPLHPIITFGRLRDMNGKKANDIVLTHNDLSLVQQISRWHFEVRRMPDGLILRSVSIQPTEVNGKAVSKGEEAAIAAGTIVRLSNVLTLRFTSSMPGVPTQDDAVTVIS